MDIPKLKSSYGTLLGRMKELKMRANIINATRNMCLKMFEHEGEYGSYLEYYEKFINPDGYHNPSQKNNHDRNTFRRIWAFDEFEHLPDRGMFNPVGLSHSSLSTLNPTFSRFVEKDVKKVLKYTQSSEKTLYNEVSMVAKFLKCMQENGAKSLKGISAERISYFFYDDGKVIRSRGYSAIIRMIFGRIDDPECQRIKDLIPKIPKVLEKQPIINESAMDKLRDKISSGNTSFCLRDRAIISIVSFTGMRATDVVNLTVDNIDWDRDLITIIQHKTQQRLTLPLRAYVGNALFDYLKSEVTNKKKIKLLFHTDDDYTKPLNPKTVGDIIERFFEDADFLDESSQRRVRMLRHFLASSLLKSGSPINVVRSILGHSSLNAINNYIEVSDDNLRSCGLDITDFPVRDDLL